jgi:hypothetical protein
MQSQRAIEIFAGHVIQWTDLDDAGVVDEDVNPVEMVDNLSNSGLNLIAIEQIAFDSENLSAAQSEIGFGAGKFFWIARQESNTSALVANVSRQHQAESTRSASDQGNFITQGILHGADETSGYPTA